MLLTFKNVLGNFLFMFSLGCIVAGIYLTQLQSRLLAALPADMGTVALGAALIPCILFIIVGLLGVFACD